MRTVFGILGASTTACSLLLADDLGNNDRPPASAAEAGAPESSAPESGPSDSGGVVGDASADGAPTAPANVLVNPDFERAGTGCPGWGAVIGTVDRTNVAQSGQGACQVCSSVYHWGLVSGPYTTPPARVTRIVADGWFRRVPAVASSSVAIALNVVPPGGELTKKSTSYFDATDTWQRVQLFVDDVAPGSSVELQINGYYPPGDFMNCSILDNYQLTFE